MDWLNQFFVPLIQVIFLLGVIGGILFVFLRAFYKTLYRSWLWTLKYKILNKPYLEKDLQLVISTAEQCKTKEKFEMALLVNNVSRIKVYELLYLYEKIYGGTKNGRKIEKSNR